MRRPSPLPPPPADRATPATGTISAPENLAPDDLAPIEDPIDPVDADDHPTAPIIPITSPTQLQRPAGLSTGLGVTPEAAPTAADAPAIGLREVWSATRARRKALRTEVRRFTGRQRRRRMLWLGVAASLLVLVLATLGAAYSPLFAVDTITIVGASQLDAAEVEEALSDQVGTPLPLVDESAVKAALVGFPLVESYTLEARPPHELVVRIVERMPIGLIETRAGFTLVDAAGVALSTTPTATAGTPLLTIEGGTDSPAFEAVGQVMRSLPAAIRAQVTGVAASTPDDVTLTLGGTNTQVVWGSAEDSALKAVVLQSTMAARPPAGVSVYDVSSPRAVVVG